MILEKSIMEVGAIPTSLGEIINFKFHLDSVKHKYDEIRLCFATGLWDDTLHTSSPDWPQKEILWNKFLNDIRQLFFNEPPYIFMPNAKWAGSIEVATKMYKIIPQKPELVNLLCKGDALNIGKYIVVTTKVRNVNKHTLLPLMDEFMSTLLKLSTNYKIVILGERQVEMRKEYLTYVDEIFGIYNNIIDSIPSDRVLDLTVPALGETVNDLSKIRQDCLIMNQAEVVITFGIGGNFCLATSTANMTIGFRGDDIPFANAIYDNRVYSNAIITKNWSQFMCALQGYL